VIDDDSTVGIWNCKKVDSGVLAPSSSILLFIPLVLNLTEIVVGAVGKWESRGLGEISKGVWERGHREPGVANRQNEVMQHLGPQHDNHQ
jgi:hypothetical protein